MEPPTEESQPSDQLWKDPKVCFSDVVQCLGSEICAGYTRGNTTNSGGGLFVTDSWGTRLRLHTG